ncbi:low molecular weight phosphatase family protein [Mycobacterium hodleri]|uniref:Low molecular weight phosphatase family protein n=1 Tax=Mycolicibacterium hodleri TaxID=49897 RepID=A0A544VZK6_9MYCO|nr:low molecular weight phosphatase family protein [Mycolicibacterium hodleri]TQR85418.1 low molecular weight phosphatase family protein [Mycolicibacterium hodleri]
MHILFVCTGNICRSPTAERLTTARGARRQVADIQASSAGTHAVIGHPVHPEAAPVLERLGGDPSNFAARQLTAKIASAADLILTMTKSHRDAVLELAPHRLHRTFTLAEASRLISEHGARTVAELAARRSLVTADEQLDIPDPIGQSPEVFAEVGSQIAYLLPPIFEVCQPT